jgi:hypothetical protein
MARLVGKISELRGADFAHAKWEFDNKIPSHMFNVVYFEDENEYRVVKEHAKNAIDRERKVNDHYLLEMNYSNGEIIERVKDFDEIVHFREEPFRNFVCFFTKKRGFKNNSITVNFSDKYRYICLVLNHTFTDGVKFYNNVMTAILPGSQEETVTTNYNCRPIVKEALMLKSIINNARLSLTTTKHFNFDCNLKTRLHFLNINNDVITQTKNILQTSFNYVCMAFVVKYIFDNSDASSLNVLVSYGFKPNDKYYNNYSFVVIKINKNDNLEKMVKKIAFDINKSKTDFVGNYEMTHNYSGLEKIFKYDRIDLVYASMLCVSKTHYSNYAINVEPTMPAYVCVTNSKANHHSSVAISIKSKGIFLKNNDFSNPKMLKTSTYL